MKITWMRLTGHLPFLFLAVGLAWGGAYADITETTPYDYRRPPKPGKERGTYMVEATGMVGDECFFVFSGGAKYLPNGDGIGGRHCFKGNVQLSGTGPLCFFAPLMNPVPFVAEATYTYNGDGTLCESYTIKTPPLEGLTGVFHTYVDRRGRWVNVSGQDIAYACPNLLPNLAGISSGLGLKIAPQGDDPFGSGELTCDAP